MATYSIAIHRVVYVALLIGGCLGYSGCQPPEDPLKDLSTDQMAVVNALNKVVIPLQDADPNRDLAEWAPLDTVLAKAQVIGLGEGTHGTREFFQVKHRLFKYLVQKHGFQTIAFEANFGRSVLVNRFIHGQTTNLTSAAAAAKSMYFWTWSTDEVRALLQWMKDYNASQSAAQQLSFYGFDCQFGDDEFPILKEYLTKVDLQSVSLVDTLSSIYTPNGKQVTAYAQRLPGLNKLFVENESKWVAVTGRTEYEIARQAVRVLIQQQDLMASDLCSQYVKRDQYMAENIQWMVSRMNISKVSLWAHNFHICNLPQYNCGSPTMGYYLKQQLKEKYLPVGQFFTDGTFNVVQSSGSPKPQTVQTVKDSYNYLLGRVKYANFALNLSQAVSDPILLNWMSSPTPLFEIGGLYDETQNDRYYTRPSTLTGRFDVLIHFRNTGPTQFLP